MSESSATKDPVSQADVTAGERMQCKDIPDRPILEFLEKLNGRWANWYFDDECDVRLAMPKDVPEKLVLAKMRQMIHRKVVDGCKCGCRGDFVITDKGRAEIAPAKPSQP